MSIEKNMNTRIQHKHDTEANWNRAINFIPKMSEIIIYDKDDSIDFARIKIGDGVTTVINLPFITLMPEKGVDYWTDEDKAEIKAYVNEAILGGTW